MHLRVGGVNTTPHRRVRTIETHGILIKPPERDCARAAARREVTVTLVVVIEDKRKHNTGIAILILNVLHVFTVWAWIDGLNTGPQLVLRLECNNWAAVGDLSCTNELANAINVELCGIDESRGQCSWAAGNALQL